METKKLLVTHHAPDLDAVGAVWLFKRFSPELFADAKVAFVNPGETITRTAAEILGFDLQDVTHVDTGLGEFDHHQPDRAVQPICAASLVFDDLSQSFPHLQNDAALRTLVEYINDVDHFGEIHWPDSSHWRYSLMIHELLHGLEFQNPYDDEALLQFGMQCLDAAYSSLKQNLKAYEVIAHNGVEFELSAGIGLALETSNDDTIKIAQKQGYILVVRKDPKLGNIRIKARPDSSIDLRKMYDLLCNKDPNSTWYYHNSGKMLLNGSHKHRNQIATKLSLEEVVRMLRDCYGK
ncbi:MAG TPA: hypothetical protein PKJ26_00575 [Candidatus Woesebacteria bacterium]|nr:hypothetical protein [Candidatus Woesebacteria bacterium]HNS64970.1 hypothetical protein [Candidatus Woesebacteria bacterium]